MRSLLRWLIPCAAPTVRSPTLPRSTGSSQKRGGPTIATLLTDDQPYVVTLSCGFDAANRRLCFHVANSGRKLDIIARNPKACATVDRGPRLQAG